MVQFLPGSAGQTDAAVVESLVRRRYIASKMLSYLPVLLSVVWILLGTVFYAVHDHLGWPRALFMSVNVGWSIGWSMEGLSEFDSPWSKLFTIYHTSIGVLFAGISVLIIAEEVGKDKDNWIMQVIKVKEYDAASRTEGCWDSFVGMMQVHMPTLKIVFVFLVWLSFGLLWYPFTNSDFSMSKNVDWLMSTLTAGGYLTIPSTVNGLQLVVTALYTNIGVPLMSISLGLLMSLILQAPEENMIFNRIIAPVTDEEIKFMQEFGMEDGDGEMDSKEFIIMAAMRIGGASPDLIQRINERFKMLDRKHVGKIRYDDMFSSARRKRLPSDTLTLSGDSSARVTISDRRKTQQNSSIFSARAKKVFSGSKSTEAEDDIAANVLRIEDLSPNSSSSKASIRRVMPNFGSSDLDDHDYPPSSSHNEKYQLSPKDVEKRDVCADEVEERFQNARSSDACHDDVEVLDHTSPINSKVELVDLQSSDVPHPSVVSEAPSNRLVLRNMDSIIDDAPSLRLSSESDTGAGSIVEKPKKSLQTPKVVPFDSNNTDPLCSLSAYHSGQDIETGDMKTLSTTESIAVGQASTIVTAGGKVITVAKTNAVPSSPVKSGVGRRRQSASTKETGSDDDSDDSARHSKHYGKLLQAKIQRRLQRKHSAEKKKKGVWELRLLVVKKAMTSSYACAFYLWSLWLVVGAVFFTLEEDLSVCEGIFFSTSIGYGIFWNEQTSSNDYSTIFTCFHYFVGVLAVSFAIAVFARSLNLSKKRWYEDAKLLHDMRTASLYSGDWDDVVIYFNYYWPKVYVHFFFMLWVLLGIVWGVSSVQWSVLDAWLFAMTAMAKGGLVALPSSGVHEWDYVFYSLYIVVGAPLMAVSCGTAANAISNYGRAQQKEKDLNSAMTEDELVMLNHLGIEDNDGFVDGAEFTILLLVRIGALNPDLIGVLHDRYYELGMDGTGCGVTYAELQNRQSFMSKSMKMSFKSPTKSGLGKKSPVKA